MQSKQATSIHLVAPRQAVHRDKDSKPCALLQRRATGSAFPAIRGMVTTGTLLGTGKVVPILRVFARMARWFGVGKA